MLAVHPTNNVWHSCISRCWTFRRSSPLHHVRAVRLTVAAMSLTVVLRACPFLFVLPVHSMSPVGKYYPVGHKPVALLASTQDVRAWRTLFPQLFLPIAPTDASCFNSWWNGKSQAGCKLRWRYHAHPRSRSARIPANPVALRPRTPTHRGWCHELVCSV